MATLNFPTITIDHEKCTVPFACKKCMMACPTAVFTVAAVKVEKGRETDPNEPGSFMAGVSHRDKCSGCDECIEVCPEDAITITFPN